MAHTLPPLNWLRAFECAARHLSFTAAAGELNLTQSAVSQHVRSLELRLGTLLFKRKARGLALTDSGRRLLPTVTTALTDLTAATAMFMPLRTDDSLKIACSWSFSLAWLSPRLERFLETRPGIRMQIVSTLWPDDNKLTEAEIEIRYGSRELVGDGAELLFADEVLPVCAPQKLPRNSTTESIYQSGLIHTVGTTDTWYTWAEHLGEKPPDSVCYSVDSYSVALELACNGVGVALVSRAIAKRSLDSGELVAPVDLVAPAIDNHYLAINSEEVESSLANRFANWLRSEVSACC
ncbi:MAG: LysR family transcriptional regulator [Gammaproteobacteria bacterium]|nr:LysR family transcriptional regulator [Gammaproteobacteria bacterium]